MADEIKDGAITPADSKDVVIKVPDGASPPGMGTGSSPSKTYEAVVYGKKVELTEADLIREAQKGLAANQRFQEASRMLEEAKAAKSVHEDLHRVLEEGDINAFRRVAESMGLDRSQVEEAADIVWQQINGDTEEEEEEETPRGRQEAPRKLSFGDLDEETQEVLVGVAADRINKSIKGALDNDEIIGYYLKQAGDKQRDAIVKMANREVKGRLTASGGNLKNIPGILKEVIPIVKETIEAFGIERSTPQMGLGPAPAGGPDVYPKQQPKYVSSRDSGFEQHILETLAFNLRNGE